MSPPATGELITTELPRQMPAAASPRLRTLLEVHARVVPLRWLERHDSPDGTVHRFPDGPVMRVRTHHLIPVHPLERTPCP